MTLVSNFKPSTVRRAIRNVNRIVTVGSMDALGTSAAVLRVIGKNKQVGITITQAFQVDQIDINTWMPNSVVVFIDLAVNNANQQMTADFVNKIRDAGHTIIAIIDEHDRSHWLQAYGDLSGLMRIHQQSQKEGVFKSSGAILREALGETSDAHTLLLLENAAEGDLMLFDTHFGQPINEAVKSAMQNNKRREYLIRHFAWKLFADELITAWVKEYAVLLANNKMVIDARVDLGGGFVRVNATNIDIDMSTLMKSLYDMGIKVVVLIGMAYHKVKGEKTEQASFGTDQKVDLIECLKTAGIPYVGGFGGKANVELDQEKAALKAIRSLFAN